MSENQCETMERVLQEGYRIFDPGRRIPGNYYVGWDCNGDIDIVDVTGKPLTTLTADNGLKFYIFPEYNYGSDNAPDGHVMYLADDIYRIAFKD